MAAVEAHVKDLVTGTHHRFDDLGLHTFKGVDGPWRLHTLQAPSLPER